MSTPHVWWTGPLQDGSGYAAEGRLLVRALSDCGVKVRAESLQQGILPSTVESELLPGLGEPFAWDASRAVHIAHLAWADPFPSRPTQRVVWRTMFETDSLPRSWVERSKTVDEIWVPSQWNRMTFASAGVDEQRIRVLHEPLDLTLFDAPGAQPARTDRLVLLSVFAWQLRKGWDVLLDAYFTEFDRDDPVTLVLRADPFLFNGNSEPVESQLQRFLSQRKYKNRPHVELITEYLPTKRYRQLFTDAHAFVLPSRGEGWGRPIAEAQALGLPVITTGWGGQTEFLDPETDVLLDYELVPVTTAEAAEYGLFRGHRWAAPSVEHLRSVMRRMLEGERSHDSQRRAAAERVRQHYAPSRIGRTMLDYLREPL